MDLHLGRNSIDVSAFMATEGHFVMEALMNKIMKAAAGAILAAGIAAATTAPADAAVHVGFGIPGPVVYPAPYYLPPPCYRFRHYVCPRPAYFGPAYYRYWGPSWRGWYPVRHYHRW